MSGTEHGCEIDNWGMLIVGALAVSGTPLDKVLAIRAELDSAGLLNPKNLADWGPERVTRELYKAGYRRGLLTGVYAERLVAIGEFAAESTAEAEHTLASRDIAAIRNLLLPVFGIGPKVIENFLTLTCRDH